MKASKMIVSALSGLAMLTAGSAMAAPVATPVTVNGGTINFTGDVTDAACTVDPSSDGQDINLGSVKAADVVKGKTNSTTRFDIVLDDCSIDTYTTASFGFNGKADANDVTVLGNTAGPGSAKGVGVQLLDSDGSPISIGGDASANAKMKLAKGTNIASFAAGIIGTDTVVSGHVAATTNFTVHYE